MAIKDWKLKKEMVRIAFGQMRQNDVPDQVMDANNFDEKRYGFSWDSLLDMYGHRFDKERINVGPNSKYRVFFNELSMQLACDEVVPGTTIIEGSALDFLRILPSQTRENLLVAMNQGGVQLEFREQMASLLVKEDSNTQALASSPLLNAPQNNEVKLFDSEKQNWYPIFYTPSDKLPTIKDGLDSGHIDQSLYYQNTDAVNRWYSITNDDFYTGFDQCKTGLLKLIRSSYWLDFVSANDFDGIVMLCGGGAHSKDAILIKSILDAAKQNKLSASRKKYSLVDRSSAMLELSRTKIEELLDKKDAHHHIEIKALRRDVMAMNGSEPVRDKGKVAWFNTGGTLGNLEEAHFFESLSAVSKQGDLLVLGVNCSDAKGEVDLDAIAKEYESDVVKDLVAVPLSAVWSSLAIDESPEDAMASIKVEAVANTYSDVPNSVTVVAKLPSKVLGEIILFKSSRYNEAALLEFATHHGWTHQSSIDGLDNAFKQIVFKRDS
jgi:hypothetical protein